MNYITKGYAIILYKCIKNAILYQQNQFIVRQPLYCTPNRTKRACEMAISADNNSPPLSKAVVDVIQFEFGAQIMALLAQPTNLNNQQNQSYGFYLSLAA